MKHIIKELTEVITHGYTQNLFRGHVKNVEHVDNHVIIYVDNAGPLREFADKRSDEQLKKAVKQVCGEECTYELKLYKGDVRNEREKKLPRRSKR